VGVLYYLPITRRSKMVNRGSCYGTGCGGNYWGWCWPWWGPNRLALCGLAI